jgi:hypothetical protein
MWHAHGKPTVGCQIIYQLWYLKKKIGGGGLYKYHMNNIFQTAKFLPTWGLNQRYCPGL